MKIALIGNTCNNNFSLMRFFRDLGHDAHLFLYSNEGFTNENPIHNPEWDTWEILKWEKYIHRLHVPNGIETIIGRPDKFKLPPSLDALKKSLNSFEYIIGSGITPSLMWRINIKLDIFFPYSTGIEWVGELENNLKLKKYNLEWPFRKFIYNTQVKGIKSAKIVNIYCGGYTEEVLKNNNISYVYMHIPQYYNLDELPLLPPNKHMNNILSKIENAEFSIFSFMRHLWVFNNKIYSKDNWDSLNKNNDWLIKGFRQFLDESKANAILFLSSWGPDVFETKKLVERLQLLDFVVWLPLLPRREIGFLLNRAADLGVGEFVCSKGEIWGSTGWENLAAGVPFLQSINYTNSEFFREFGYELPPFTLNVKSAEDVAKHMLECYNNKDKIKKQAQENIRWFNENNGISLAKKWILQLNSIKKIDL